MDWNIETVWTLLRRFGGRPLTITFAEARAPREASAAPVAAGVVKSVFVGQLPETATDEKLKEIFSAYGAIERCAPCRAFVMYVISRLCAH